jgi:hypothetical protein
MPSGKCRLVYDVDRKTIPLIYNVTAIAPILNLLIFGASVKLSMQSSCHDIETNEGSIITLLTFFMYWSEHV